MTLKVKLIFKYKKKEGKRKKEDILAGIANVSTNINHDASCDAKSAKNHEHNSAAHTHHPTSPTGNFL